MAKTPALPLFAYSLGAHPATIGWVIMASTLPGVLISLPAGLLRDRIGTRPLLIASLFVFATAPLLYLLVLNVGQLILIRFYHGFATALFGTTVTAEIAERYQAGRGHALATFSAISTTGRSIAPFLGGLLISWTSFPGLYVGCAIAGVLALTFGLQTPAEPEIQHTNSHWSHNLRTILKDRIIIGTSIVEALQYLVFGSVEAFLAVYTVQAGWAAWRIGVLLGIQLLAVIFLKPKLGKLSDRIGRKPLILSGLAVGALALCGLPFTHNFILLIIINIAFGAGFSATTAATSALVGDRSRNGNFGASIGVLRSIMDIGQAIGPVLTGWLIEIGGYRTAFLSLAGLLILSLVSFFRTTKSADLMP